MLSRASKTIIKRCVNPSIGSSIVHNGKIITGAINQQALYSTIYDNYTPYQDINRHRSDAEQRIEKVPVVEIEGNMAICDGGGGALGHPIEYIQLDTLKPHSIETCKYCGIRFKMKDGYHAHGH